MKSQQKEVVEGKRRNRFRSRWQRKSRHQARRKYDGVNRIHEGNSSRMPHQLALPPTRAQSHRDLSESRSGSLIAPSKEAMVLMRRIGALGMEDPVFGTKEQGPDHASHLYEDMSLGDVPLDMRDLISIASDPTAELDNGIDSIVFHTSMNEVSQSMSEFSQTELLVSTEMSGCSYAGSAFERQFGSRSRKGRSHQTKHTYMSGKVDPWGLNKQQKHCNCTNSDWTEVSETHRSSRSGTSVVSLTLNDLTTTKPVDPSSAGGKYEKSDSSLQSGVSRTTAGNYRRAASELTLQVVSPIPKTNSEIHPRYSCQNMRHCNIPYTPQTGSVASSSVSSSPSTTSSVSVPEDEPVSTAVVECLDAPIKRRGCSIGQRSSSFRSHRSVSCRPTTALGRSRSESILSKPTDFDKFDAHAWPERKTALAVLGLSPRGKSKTKISRRYGEGQKTWSESVMGVSNPIPEVGVSCRPTTALSRSRSERILSKPTDFDKFDAHAWPERKTALAVLGLSPRGRSKTKISRRYGEGQKTWSESVMGVSNPIPEVGVSCRPTTALSRSRSERILSKPTDFDKFDAHAWPERETTLAVLGLSPRGKSKTKISRRYGEGQKTWSESVMGVSNPIPEVGVSCRPTTALSRSRSERILSKPTDFDKFDAHAWPERKTTLAVLGLSPLGKPKTKISRRYGKGQKTWSESVMGVSNPIPEVESSDLNLMPNIIVERRHSIGTPGLTDGTKEPQSRSTRTVSTKPKRMTRTPFVVKCASTIGMEPRLLPTIAAIFNHDVSAALPNQPTTMKTTPSKRTTATNDKDAVDPRSIRSFYGDEDETRPLVRETTKGGTIKRDSGRYFESTHAVKSIVSVEARLVTL